MFTIFLFDTLGHVPVSRYTEKYTRVTQFLDKITHFVRYLLRAKIKIELGPNVHPSARCQLSIFQRVFAECLITERKVGKTEKYFRNA